MSKPEGKKKTQHEMTNRKKYLSYKDRKKSIGPQTEKQEKQKTSQGKKQDFTEFHFLMSNHIQCHTQKLLHLIQCYFILT